MTKILCIGFLILTGVPALYAAFAAYRKTLRKFRKTEGKIVDNTLESIAAVEAPQLTLYGSKIQFVYVVDGTAYNSDTLSLKRVTTTDIEQVERIRQRFPTGKQVQVYYNPEDPSEAYLSPPSKITGEMINYIFFVFIITIALTLIFLAVL